MLGLRGFHLDYILMKDVEKMAKIKEFLKKKNIQLSAKRYGIDALGAMAQGLFCTLLVGTILNTIGQQFGIDFLNRIIVTIKDATGENQIS